MLEDSFEDDPVDGTFPDYSDLPDSCSDEKSVTIQLYTKNSRYNPNC